MLAGSLNIVSVFGAYFIWPEKMDVTALVN